MAEPYWDEVVESFKSAGFAEPSHVSRIVFTDEVRDSCRHFAAMRMDGKLLYLSPEIVEMPEETILGIMAHEAGHAVDLQNPGIYWFRRQALLVSEPLDRLTSRELKKLMDAWHDRSDEEVERVADALAEQAMGLRMGYVGKPGCLVQALGRGKKRPPGLR